MKSVMYNIYVNYLQFLLIFRVRMCRISDRLTFFYYSDLFRGQLFIRTHAVYSHDSRHDSRASCCLTVFKRLTHR